MAIFGKFRRCFVESTYPGMKCTFCDMPVLIETAKTNERGQLIHEDCYVRSLQVNRDPRANAAPLGGSTVQSALDQS
jgi:hypothetical protein